MSDTAFSSQCCLCTGFLVVMREPPSVWRNAGTEWTLSVAPIHESVRNTSGAKWPRSSVVMRTWSALTARGRHRRPRGLQSFLMTGRLEEPVVPLGVLSRSCGTPSWTHLRWQPHMARVTEAFTGQVRLRQPCSRAAHRGASFGGLVSIGCRRAGRVLKVCGAMGFSRRSSPAP